MARQCLVARCGARLGVPRLPWWPGWSCSLAEVGTDWSKPTKAKKDADSGLGIIDGLMEYASDQRGARSKKEKSLYMASVVFAYAVWENFVEQISIEVVTRLADPAAGLRPEQLNRPQVRALIEEGASVWELAVYPGWKQLWINRVKQSAVGEDGRGWGVNTANAKNTVKLFKGIGISPFPEGTAEQLDALVALRGEIVHTGKTRQPIYKDEVSGWRKLVAKLCYAVDVDARLQCQAWLAE